MVLTPVAAACPLLAGFVPVAEEPCPVDDVPPVPLHPAIKMASASVATPSHRHAKGRMTYLPDVHTRTHLLLAARAGQLMPARWIHIASGTPPGYRHTSPATRCPPGKSSVAQKRIICNQTKRPCRFLATLGAWRRC